MEITRIALVVDFPGLDGERELMRAATSMLGTELPGHDRPDRALHFT
jgi:hypothetical protein